MLRTLISYVQAVRTAPPGPWALPVATVLVTVGTLILGKVATHRQELVAAAGEHLADIEEQIQLATAQRNRLVAKPQPEKPAYPADEDLAPLGTVPDAD
jgi:hypothetical protein